jgi:hypothetical protein
MKTTPVPNKHKDTGMNRNSLGHKLQTFFLFEDGCHVASCVFILFVVLFVRY